MKCIILSLLAIALAFTGLAQEKTPQKEVGAVFNNLDNFGLTFRFGNNQALWRINALTITGSESGNIPSNGDSDIDTRQVGFGIGLAREWRKPIADKLELRYGTGAFFSYSYSKLTETDPNNPDFKRGNENTNYRPGINLIAGVNYWFNDRLALGAEFLPQVSYNRSKLINEFSGQDDDISESESINYGFNTNSAALSLIVKI